LGVIAPVEEHCTSKTTQIYCSAVGLPFFRKPYVLLGSISFLLAVACWLGGSSLIHFLWTETLIGISVASFGYRELMGYSDTNARYARSRTQFVRAREALSLARPDPHDSGCCT
jgi:hypothetical protein